MNKRNGCQKLMVILLAPILSFITTFSFTSAVCAADFPKKAIALVIGSTPGGGYDLQGRIFAKYWPKYLPKKVPMIVKNESGGGGLVAANRVWAASPDGYTIKQIKVGPYMISQQLYPKRCKFDMEKWIYIGRYTYDINAILTRTEVAQKKIKSYQDLVNYSKEKPLVVATGGVGGSMHTKAMVFSEASGIPLRYVHFPGANEAMASILRGECDFSFISASTAGRQDPKEIQTIFIFYDKKHKTTDFAPNAVEFGVPQNILEETTDSPVFSSPRAWAVPPKTPSDVVNILRESFWKLATSKEFDGAFDKAGHFLDAQKAEDFEKKLPKMIANVKKFAPSLKEEVR